MSNKTLTVKDVFEKLQQMPQDALLQSECCDRWIDVCDVEFLNPENKWKKS